MTKKIIVLFLLLTFTVLLCSCDDLNRAFQAATDPNFVPEPDYFDIVSLPGDLYLVVDLRTGCQYLGGYRSGFVLIVDSYGDPLIYDGVLGGELK